ACPLAINLLAGAGIVAGDVSLAVADVKQVLPQDRRADIARRLAGHVPDRVRLGDIAGAAQPYCHHRPGPARHHDQLLAVEHRNRLAEESLVIALVPFTVPDFLAGFGIVPPDAERPIEDQIGAPARHRNQHGRAETLPLVPFRLPDLVAGLP